MKMKLESLPPFGFSSCFNGMLDRLHFSKE
jgi:hypothetical protein